LAFDQFPAKRRIEPFVRFKVATELFSSSRLHKAVVEGAVVTNRGKNPPQNSEDISEAECLGPTGMPTCGDILQRVPYQEIKDIYRL
jgi:hypothetical protein